MPDWLANAPEVEPHQEYLWEVFWTLHTSRNVGMGEGAIPVSEIEAYCRLMGISGLPERDELLRGVRALDIEYLSIRAEQRRETG